MGKDEHPKPVEDTTYQKFYGFFFNLIDKPATYIRDTIVEPTNSKNKQYYYHRQFRRVPTFDECELGNQVCWYEANEQFKRDKKVDEQILMILRNRRIECEYYWKADTPRMCKQITEDYMVNSANFFEKYGDMGPNSDVSVAYQKQKHRMVWERRHGKVGSGMKENTNSIH